MKRQWTIEMKAQGPISQANPVAAALDEANDIPASVSCLCGTGAVGCSIGQSEKSNVTAPRCSHGSRGRADAMHDLASTITAVLINAQMLEWKLPPYSRLKRLVREIERHAQRSGALVKGLLGGAR
jgi:hypothetical protein